MSQDIGYEKRVRKLKDLGLMTYTDEQLPYGYIYKGAWKGTLEAAADNWWLVPRTGGLPVSGHYVPSGQQMKMLFLRIISEDGSGAQFAIVQSGSPANAARRGNSILSERLLRGRRLRASGAPRIRNIQT